MLQNKSLDDFIENYVIQLSNLDKLIFRDKLYKFIYLGHFEKDELSEHDLMIFKKLKNMENFRFLKLIQNLIKHLKIYMQVKHFAGNAHKLFSGVVKNEEI